MASKLCSARSAGPRLVTWLIVGRARRGSCGLNLRRIASLSKLRRPNCSTKHRVRKRGWSAFFRNTFRTQRKSKDTHQDCEPGGAFGEAKTGPADSRPSLLGCDLRPEWAWVQKSKQIINLGHRSFKHGCCTSDTAVATNRAYSILCIRLALAPEC